MEKKSATDQANVLLIYTGGTIGMINDPISGALKAFDFSHLHEQIPELKRMPVTLSSVSFASPIDSSEMNPEHWIKLGEIVAENYSNYDGFVILHGTDTMAFTASALSFMFEGLKKPVILTGSQLPMGTLRTDGKENLLTAIEIAAAKNSDGSAIVQEVAVYFEFSLFRGNRCSKISATEFDAFASPNYPKLVQAGVNLRYETDKLWKSQTSEFKLEKEFDTRIALLKIFPGFNATLFTAIFDVENIKIIIIESFGAGNMPSDTQFMLLIKKYINAGGIVLNITQCSSGNVEQGKYATSSFLQEVGAISGNDLTTEAAVTKCMHLLARCKSAENVRKELSKNLRGEITLLN
jgi:L-asparaginase